LIDIYDLYELVKLMYSDEVIINDIKIIDVEKQIIEVDFD